MTKVKVADTTGAALDWLVAKAGFAFELTISEAGVLHGPGLIGKWAPSRIWDQGGPIIDREGISVFIRPKWPAESRWAAWHGEDDQTLRHLGPTPLIAAMRCFVASKLGDEVDVPGGLL